MKLKLMKLTCLRCGKVWIPTKEEIRICPKCKSAYWNIPKKTKKEEGE